MTFGRIRAGLATGLLVGVEIGMVGVLHRLGSVDGLDVGWGDLRDWLATTPAEDVLVAIVRLLALGVAVWLLASTALYLAASVLRLPGAVRRLRWATPPGVRRLVDGIVAGTIVAATTFGAAGPALAQDPAAAAAHAYVPHPAGDAPAPTPVPAGVGAPVTTTTTAAPLPPQSVPAPPAQPPPSPDPTYRVERGDNFWRIAERHVAQATGRRAAELRVDDVRPYWLRLVEANRAHLASGDPDLIYPGEGLIVPEVFDHR